MAKLNPFNPTWTTPHPGEHLRDCLEEYGMSLEDVAQVGDIPLDDLRAFLRGERKIDDRMATAFSQAFIPDWRGAGVMEGTEDGRAAFWLRLQARYDREKEGR